MLEINFFILAPSLTILNSSAKKKKRNTWHSDFGNCRLPLKPSYSRLHWFCPMCNCQYLVVLSLGCSSCFPLQCSTVCGSTRGMLGACFNKALMVLLWVLSYSYLHIFTQYTWACICVFQSSSIYWKRPYS